MTDTLKIEIEAPWGNCKFTGLLGFYKQGLDQLIFYQKAGNSSEYLKRDIKGYKELLASKSEENAFYFKKTKIEDMERKHNGGEKKFKDNLEIIKHLKGSGLWCIGKVSENK